MPAENGISPSEIEEENLKYKIPAETRYRGKSKVINGLQFYTEAEAKRWKHLTRLAEKNEICQLRRRVKVELQPKFRSAFIKREFLPVNFTADFCYFKNETKKFVLEQVVHNDSKYNYLLKKLLLYSMKYDPRFENYTYNEVK